MEVLAVVVIREAEGWEVIHNCPICGVNVDKMSDYDYGFHIIDCQEKRIAELEQELKNQVELHNEWLGTYRIKLDYIEELERKIKRLTTVSA